MHSRAEASLDHTTSLHVPGDSGRWLEVARTTNRHLERRFSTMNGHSAGSGSPNYLCDSTRRHTCVFTAFCTWSVASVLVWYLETVRLAPQFILSHWRPTSGGLPSPCWRHVTPISASPTYISSSLLVELGRINRSQIRWSATTACSINGRPWRRCPQQSYTLQSQPTIRGFTCLEARMPCRIQWDKYR